MIKETQTAENAKKATALAEAKNSDLIKKLEDSEKKADEQHILVQRFVKKMQNLTILEHFSRFKYSVLLSVSIPFVLCLLYNFEWC